MPPSFHQQLLLTIVDKLIIAGALVLVGFWLNRRLEGFKSAEAAKLQNSAQIAAARLPAYQKFWEIQEETAESVGVEFTPAVREELERRLRRAYFSNGNGILLTPSGMKCYRTAMKRLKDDGCRSEDIRKAFTLFRRQLKIDVGAYNDESAATPTDPDGEN